MVYICCVPGCGTTGKKIFHSFPKNEIQCEKWRLATMCFPLSKQTAWKTHYNVCRKHFKPQDFKNWNLLKRGVVPSLMLPHTITMEHDYCTRNSIFIQPSDECDLSSQPGNNNADEVMDVDLEIISERNGSGNDSVFDEKVLATGAGNRFPENSKDGIEVEVKKVGRSESLIETSWIVDQNMIVKDNLSSPTDCAAIDQTNKTKAEVQQQVLSKNSISESTSETSKPKSTKTYDPIARKMRYLTLRNKNLSRRLKEMQAANLKSNKSTKAQKKIQSVLRTLSTELPAAQFNFVKLQIKNSGKKKKGYRFTFDEKTLALVIYKRNPKRYKDLLKITNLPTRQTLITHSAAIQFKEGLNQKLMDFIKAEVSKMSEIDKYCTIGWDEISLATHLDFNQVKDYIDGFEDLGSKRSTTFATHALVFMVRGISKAYKQPVCYFLTNSLCAPELAKLIKLVIEAVLDTGLKVVGSVCDAVYTNGAAVNKLINPNCRRGYTTLGQLLEYTIGGVKICHIFDPPHLIKSVRNNLLVKDLNHTVAFNELKFRPNGLIVWNEKNKQERSASWADLRAFYKMNSEYKGGLFNLIPNITDEHLDPGRRKMKVKLATQVFSGTFGRNMYLCWKRKQFSNNCIGTAAILLFFNELFDSVNGGDVPVPDKLTGGLTKGSKHFGFWDYAMRMLETMKFSDNLKTGRPNQSNVFAHFISTLKGMRQLSERLFEFGIQSISLRRWNQDGLENYFSVIRSLCGSNTKPNARDFRSAFSTSILNNLLTDHSLNANCEPDKDEPFLQNLEILFKPDDRVERVEPIQYAGDDKQKYPDVVNDTNFLETEGQNCISGKICEKLLVKMKCEACVATVIHVGKGKCIEHDVMRKQSAVDETILPKIQFIECIKAYICKVKNMLPVLCAEKNLLHSLVTELALENNNNQSFGCELHRKGIDCEIKKITVKITIERYILQINRILSGKVTVATEDPMQKKALEFRTKNKHIGKFVALPVQGA